MALDEYSEKRDFTKTPEPAPKRRAGEDRLLFVIQKHAARRLHYDLRLELDGVLKSWAVPKGPSLDPSAKRLAMMVEDHPFDYKDFEGIIPEGSYGAGGVIIWDRGTYRHPAATGKRESERLLREGLEKGDLKFVLEGVKLKGQFTLVRIRKQDDDGNAWLLFKKKDRFATSEDILSRDRSVVTEKRLEEISPPQKKKSRKVRKPRPKEMLPEEDLRGLLETPMPHRIRPMLATLIQEPFNGPDWVFEIKWDGYRAVAEIEEGKVSLYSRNLLSFNERFSPIVKSLETLDFPAVLDGEIVVVDETGRPNFQWLQNYEAGAGRLIYYVFDLLHLKGRDLTGLPLIRRKEILKKFLPPLSNVKFSDHIREDGILFFRLAQEKGLEGIVAKHSGSAYEAGKRSRRWLKIKSRLRQEAVIGGFTEPKGMRKHFGALVLGVYEGNELVYIGHSGGGFDEKTLEGIRRRLDSLVQKECPFKVKPKTNTPVTWVQPKLACEVAFSGWTDEGLMRHPIFLGLRE
jgi:bifunctional non-homologous end joining protein LigD